jgi:hypothetical protein
VKRYRDVQDPERRASLDIFGNSRYCFCTIVAELTGEQVLFTVDLPKRGLEVSLFAFLGCPTKIYVGVEQEEVLWIATGSKSKGNLGAPWGRLRGVRRLIRRIGCLGATAGSVFLLFSAIVVFSINWIALP